MGKQVFHFNTVTHSYEAYSPGLGQRMLRIGLFAAIAVIISLGIRYSLHHQLSNPKEIKLLAEKEVILEQYMNAEIRIAEIENALRDYQKKDDNIYRSFYEMDPIPLSLREAGLGGAENYQNLRGYENSDIMIGLIQRTDMAGVKMDVQGNSFNDLLSKASFHKELIDHKPSIQPISLKNFYWISSVYGHRTDPMSKRRTMHWGLDFAGRTGLKVFATGDGVVTRTKSARYGFGKEVLIDHGFGYLTRYGHLESILVERGQKIKRGTVIGTLGSTGKSTGPHLHYEVRHYGRAQNPKYYYSEDLSSEEYDEIINLSGSVDN